MLELDDEKVEKLKKIAQQKKVDQFSLIKGWIDEGIKREAV